MAENGKHKAETEERTPFVGEPISVWVNEREFPGVISSVLQDVNEEGYKSDYEQWRTITAIVFQGNSPMMFQLKYNTGPFEKTWCYPGERQA